MKRMHERKMLEFEVLKAVYRYRSRLPKTGTRKLWRYLKAHFPIGRDHLFRLLRAQGLLVPRRPKQAPKGYSIGTGPYQNLTRNLCPTKPHQLWISDITYIRYGDRFYYLSLVADAYSRRIIGYTIEPKATAQSVSRALEQAIPYKTDNQTLILHFDQGPQYHSKQLLAQMKTAQIQPSMSRRACPQDNARMERIIGILKQEFDLKRVFYNDLHLKSVVHDAIWKYNHLRMHTALDYRTPAAVENAPFYSSTLART